MILLILSNFEERGITGYLYSGTKVRFAENQLGYHGLRYFPNHQNMFYSSFFSTNNT